ncbi:MAG: precorrin-2 C(20)-methyltransferase [Ferrimicrobium sp.]
MTHSDTRTLVGLGVGPGDPELLTLRGFHLLATAEVVFVPTVDDHIEGRAESIVRALLPNAPIERVVFPMTRGISGILQRREVTRAAVDQLITREPAWLRGVFVTLGDPSIYSTFSLVAEFVRELAPDIVIEVVPGIMAFQSLVARLGVNFLDNEEDLRLVAGLGPDKDLCNAIGSHNSAVVIYKVGSALSRIRSLAVEQGRIDQAIIGWHLGTGQERIEPLSSAPSSVPYLSTIVITPHRQSR